MSEEQTAEQELLTTQEVADQLRVERQTVYRWIESGRIEAIKLRGGTIRIRQSEINRLLGE